MKKLLSKILISVAMLGIFLMPISAGINFDNTKAEVSTNKASAQEQPRWWLVYSVPVVGLVIVGFDEEKACTDKEAEEKAKGNKIGRGCTYGIKPVYNAGGQQITETDLDYGCSIYPTTWDRCFIKVIFKLIWEPLAWVANLAASVLDFFLYYSTDSQAYKNGFIDNAWATVRDVANLFFILGLLYVAIKTILGLNVTDNKKIIGGIIIIALVINFSLFATRVVIDASNVLAKIFYNQITPQDANGKILEPGENRHKSVTVGIVSIINPQKILGQENITNNFGQFVIVLFITLAMIIYMIFMFLSLAMLFVSRIAMLWISMIFSPIAFITYALHVNIPGLGFKEWSKNLIGNAFMAPIFIFMMYIILLLGNTLTSITYVAGSGDATLNRTMASIIPLLIIFILLKKTKEMTVKYAGEMGEVFTKAGSIGGGLILGGAAMTTAFAGRQTIGRFMKSASLSESAQKYGDPTQRATLKGWDRFKGWAGHNINKNQTKIEGASHARHELDKEASARFDGKKFKELTATERDTVRERINRNYEGEKVYGKNYAQLDATQKKDIDDKIKLNILMGAKTKATELEEKSKEKQSIVSSLAQSARTGGFDLRDLSKVTAKEGDDGLNKFASGLTSILGNTMRSGIKNSIQANYGTGQKDFFKDLGHTITEAMKGANIKVDLSHVGHEEKEDHGHGGGGHH